MPRSPKLFAVTTALTVLGAIGLYLAFRPTEAVAQLERPWPKAGTSGDPLWGCFSGRIPAVGIPNCEVVKVSLAVYQKPGAKNPATYWLGRVLVGVGNKRHVAEGTVTTRRGVKDYPDAVVYELDQNAPQDFRFFWRVNNDILLPLDDDMKPKVGNAGWGYMLSRGE